MTDEKEENSKVNDQSTTPFIEILCKTTGKTLRFAPGTKAGFALTFINNKSRTQFPFSSHIESVKDGEEPIVFGPTASLVDFGPGWKLMTGNFSVIKDKKVIDQGLFGDSNLKKNTSNQEISFMYLGKILVAFILLFLLGALCTLFLENLPQLILYIRQLAYGRDDPT